jgi:hypothetical protein
MDIKLNQDSAITVSLRRAEQIDRDSEERFVSLVESAISPAEVSWLFVFQSMKKFVPRWLFVKLLHRASRKTPYIGFMIEPYSLFLFFRLKDLDKARAMLPERYKLIKTSIFADEEPDYYYGLGAFNTRASSFWGARLESYLIAEDRETGLLSFIFIDILSNALIALPAEGIADPNCETALVTLSSRGSIFLNFQDARTRRGLKLRGNIDGGQFRPLDQRLWLTGNTSIAHSDELAAGEEDPFAVLFDPAEVEKALDIPLEDIEISENSLFPDIAETRPVRAVVFPYPQHYIADSPGCRTYVKDRSDMLRRYDEMAGRESLRTFSAAPLRIFAAAGLLMTVIVPLALLGVWLFGG